MLNYVKEANRTLSSNYPEIANRLLDEGMIDVLHGSIGIATEGSELLDAVKKHVFYGKPFDHVNAEEELGDILWYVAIVARRLGVSIEQIMEKNIAKLRKRYPEKFTETAALNRDLDAERKVLERSPPDQRVGDLRDAQVLEKRSYVGTRSAPSSDSE